MTMNHVQQSIDCLPSESIDHLFNYLSIPNLLSFCLTSVKFSLFLKDTQFWSVRSKYIHKEQVFPKFTEAIRYKFSPLFNCLLDRFHETTLDKNQMELIFWSVMKTCNLSIIQKTINKFRMFSDFKELITNILSPDWRKVKSSRRITTRKTKSGSGSYELDELTREIYRLYRSYPDQMSEMFCLFITFGDFNHFLIRVLVCLRDSKAVDMALAEALRQFSTANSTKFDKIFKQIIYGLMVENFHDGFVRIWNKYSRHSGTIEELRKMLCDRDKYPYRYIQVMGMELTPEKVRNDLLNCRYLHVDTFCKIWSEYGGLVDKDDLLRMLEEKNKDVFSFVINGGKLGSEVMELIERDDFEELREARKKGNFSGMDKILLDKVCKG